MKKTRIFSAVMAAVMGFGLLFAGTVSPAYAARKKKSDSQEKTYRIATYALGGLTAYGLVKGKGTMALLGAAGTYLAHKKWKDEIEERHDREDRYRGGRYRSRR